LKKAMFNQPWSFKGLRWTIWSVNWIWKPFELRVWFKTFLVIFWLETDLVNDEIQQNGRELEVLIE
jgi:hypothetical protein